MPSSENGFTLSVMFSKKLPSKKGSILENIGSQNREGGAGPRGVTGDLISRGGRANVLNEQIIS